MAGYGRSPRPVSPRRPESLWRPCAHWSKERGLRQHRVLTRESNSAIAPEREGGRDGSRVCAGDLESVTAGGSRLEFMAVGNGSLIFTVSFCPPAGAGIREGD